MKDESEEIEDVIRRLPKLASAKKAVTTDEAAAIIADDDHLFEAVWLYTGWNPDIFLEWPDQLKKLLGILKRVKPFSPWFKQFFRGQQGDCEEPGHLGFRSWSANRDTAESFARDWRGYGDVVCVLTRPVKAVSISDIAMWRMRLRPGESHYPGMQAEYLILDAPKS